MRDFWSKRNYSFEQIPDLTGKVAIVTGSSSGIGKVCATEMARKGCTVIVAARDEKRSQAAVEEIIEATGNKKVDCIRIDLMSLASVKKFADEFKSRYGQLNILMNNAGVMMCPFALSEDGIETQFATNHVAHHYLTMLLLPLLEASTPSRVVTVSSLGHTLLWKKFDLESISDPESYSPIQHYAMSKACNILFTRELNKRLENKGIKNVYVNCNHPGVVRSDLFRHLYKPGSWKEWLSNLIFISTEDGALTQLYLATSPEVEEKDIRGKYCVPFGVVSNPWGAAAHNDHPLELWDYTERLIKEKMPDYESPI
ncbi:NAD(P)-binding protein [Rhizopus microsporus var. microsporus]|uniref:NAD(P)-binding protein n=2 Tax=Rhizopus microsporus TaxID=58291 RepID=A0A2G4ST75_RHIZD|nr:NAD(P)-binding protein [Rhizopus microsporus ATCC 52813]ORE08105.1 NAD(P)-binding protein [Rhizopus microsporus var. microsporus]PHZ11969.1 NAD(P)-binding protein [Rhizopus microsporus ATCC 52813]